MLLATGAVIGLNSLRAPVHEASVTAKVEPDWGGRWETGVPGVQFVPLSVDVPRERVLETMKAIAEPAIAGEAIRRLGLSEMEPSELLDNLTVEQVERTTLIQLSYRDTDAQRARQLVSTVAEVASERRIGKETPYDYVLRIRVFNSSGS